MKAALATTAAALSVVGLLLALGAVVITLSELPAHRLAVFLRAHGASAVIESTSARGGSDVDITFLVDGRTIETSAPSGGAPIPDQVGRQVSCDPADPTRALLADDLEYFAEDSLDGGLAFAALSAAPALLTVLAWLALGRPDWWRHVDECWIPLA